MVYLGEMAEPMRAALVRAFRGPSLVPAAQKTEEAGANGAHVPAKFRASSAMDWWTRAGSNGSSPCNIPRVLARLGGRSRLEL
jgi:hypothetical protein